MVAGAVGAGAPAVAVGAGAANDTGAVGAAVAICFEVLRRPKKNY